MKKLVVFFGVIISAAVLLGGSFFVFSNTVEAGTVTTSIPTTLTMTTTNGVVYYYSDYEDLVQQIYDDIYDDVYNDLLDEIVLELDQDYYDEIYAEVLLNLNNLLSEDQIQLYVDDFQQNIYSIVDLAEKSVFGVTTYLPDDTASLGSGVVYKYDAINHLYYIMTNQHVIENGESFEIYLPDETTVDANLIGFDADIDIAVLTFSSVGLSNIEVSQFGDSDAIDVGEFIFAVGNPEGYDFYNSVTMGIVSGLDRYLDVDGDGTTDNYVNFIQHDAAINHGNSGGALYNLDGKLIGINVIKFATVDIEGMGFTIPINLIKDAIVTIESSD